ncbi:MMPL family transporter, partial [bacterium]|nr:MMPL family transporter [bacterium]
QLKPPLFSRVISGPGSSLGGGGGESLFSFALEQWANLMNASDYDQILERLTPVRIDEAVRAAYSELLQPTGFLQKNTLLADPLGFRELILPRLVSLNPVGKARIVDGHFLSQDGRETMLILETPVAITDFNGAKALLAELERVLAEVVPVGVEAIILSGHIYTVANATAIQRDMKVVISASLFALVLIFSIFMRQWRALFVFLIPVVIMGPALALTSLIDGSVSAITIGFGAVLLGVTIDYGLHLYFSLADRSRPAGAIVISLAPPLLGAGLTTIGAFSAQLFSALPGQRQLALFAIFGVVLALALALLLLPHFLRSESEDESLNSATYLGQGGAKARLLGRNKRADRLVVLVWFLCLLFMLGSAFKVECVGDLRQINLVPESLKKAENSLKSVWGEVRGRALVFAEGDNFAEALQVNEQLYTALRNEFTA